MAGVKGRSGGSRPNTGGARPNSGGARPNSGGARPGAGRPPKEPATTGYDDPLDFLRAVWRGEVDANASQVKAASSALPFIHKKMGEGGKKDQKQEAAQKVASRFAPASPPKLVAAGGKKV